MTLTVRPLDIADLTAVAAVHARAFPRSALTQLGPDLVARYYRWQLTGPHDVAAFGAFDGPRLIGFVVAGRFQRAISGFVNANRERLLLRVATRPWLLANDVLRQRVAVAWRWIHRRKLPPAGTALAERSTFGVLSIAVDPTAQRAGVGRALMEAVESAACQRGLHRLHLTVERANHSAVAFYERLGWRPIRRGDTWTGEMEKELNAHGVRAETTES